MLKIYLVLLFPNTVFALSCAGLPISQYALIENQEIVTIQVVDRVELNDHHIDYVDIKVIQAFFLMGF